MLAVYTQVITIIDNTRPTWTTAAGNLDRTVQCSDADGLTAAQALAPVAADNCDMSLTPVKTAGSFAVGSCPQAGSYTNTWTVSDDCGNEVLAVYTQVITIIDNTRPLITTNGNKTVDPDAGKCGAEVSVSANASDNCEMDLIPVGVRSDGKALDYMFPIGTTTIKWNAKDACGNAATEVIQTVKVNPIPVCVTYTGDLFANTSKTNKGVEIPAEIVVSISIPVSEMSCGATASLVSFTLVADDANVKPASIGSVTRVTENEFYVFSQKYSVLLGKLLSTSITITWNIGGDYIINKDCDTESLVTVSAPANDFVTGGGYIVLSEAVNGGSYIGDVGTKNNFGFNIKWAKNFTRLTGNINTIWRTDDGRRYQAKSNSAGSLVVYKKLDTDGKLIGYQANIIYTNVNIRLLGGSTNAFGNGKIIMTIYEWGEPGSNLAQKQPDEIGFVIFDSKGNIVHATNVYNNTDGLKPVDVQYLDAGNIQVHANPTNLENKSAEIATGIVPDIDFADLKVYPNPFSEKLRFEFVSPESVNARIDLYDMTGRMVKTIFEQPIDGGTNYEAEFRPEAIISGMYFYRVTMGEAIYNGKVVFKKE